MSSFFGNSAGTSSNNNWNSQQTNNANSVSATKGNTSASAQTSFGQNGFVQNNPFAPALPYLNQNLATAGNLQSSGIGAQPFSGSMVTPFARQTMAGMDLAERMSAGYAPTMQQPLQQYSAMMNTLMPIAQGDFTNDGTFNYNLGRAQQEARNGLNMNAMMAGRYNSGQHQKAVAQGLNDVTSRMMQERQQWAANMLPGYGNSMGQAYNQAMMPTDTMGRVGQRYEDLYSRTLADRQRIYNEAQTMPWNVLGMGNNIVGGIAGLGGTQISNQTGFNRTQSSQHTNQNTHTNSSGQTVGSGSGFTAGTTQENPSMLNNLGTIAGIGSLLF